KLIRKHIPKVGIANMEDQICFIRRSHDSESTLFLKFVLNLPFYSLVRYKSLIRRKPLENRLRLAGAIKSWIARSQVPNHVPLAEIGRQDRSAITSDGDDVNRKRRLRLLLAPTDEASIEKPADKKNGWNCKFA